MRSEKDHRTALTSETKASTAVDFHDANGTYRTEFDGHTRPASEAVITAVATATGNDPQELSPLYSIIDPDALDALFDAPDPSASKQPLTVTFEYADCRVSATAQGTVSVEPDWTD